MVRKIRLGLIFGGRSAEHEVSVRSAQSLVEALDREKYELTMIGISRKGQWFTADNEQLLLEPGVLDNPMSHPGLTALAPLDYSANHGVIRYGSQNRVLKPLDVFFPLLHGPYGEDGSIQGLMELSGAAYVGAGIVGSAVGMDKAMMKRAFKAEGLPQLEYTVLPRKWWEHEPGSVLDHLETLFSFPVFVKPVNMGSSVGVSQAVNRDELAAALTLASEYDLKVIVEEAAIDCREVEVAILGNYDVQASIAGEIDPGSIFYDYSTKYLDDKALLHIPARISEQTMDDVRHMALDAFQAVDACGLARVDFFVNKDDETIFINEINTMPGFTPISMYPKLWEAGGMSYSELIDQLVELALERHAEKGKTQQYI